LPSAPIRATGIDAADPQFNHGCLAIDSFPPGGFRFTGIEEETKWQSTPGTVNAREMLQGNIFSIISALADDSAPTSLIFRWDGLKPSMILLYDAKALIMRLMR
jgi:hypothetical protein